MSTSSNYPPGCTQADHDRAYGDEERQLCQECGGTGFFDDIEDDITCDSCQGTGYERVDTEHGDDAYEQRREDEDADIDW